MPELAWVNGVTTTLAEAKIPVTDAGFRLGYGIFETMRGYHQGRLFRLDAHLDRLRSGACFLGIPIDTGQIGPAALRLLAESGLPQARVRLIVTAGQAGAPSVVITVEQYRPLPEDDYRSGLAAVTASIRRYSGSPINRHKTLNQIGNSIARSEAESRGAAEAILLNERGHVAETNRGNIFIVQGGVLKTPGLDSGLLPGITRAAVLELARGLEISIIEADLCFDELHAADEVFITSSLVGVMPLTFIDGTTIGNGYIGPVTARLRQAYTDMVAAETVTRNPLSSGWTSGA